MNSSITERKRTSFAEFAAERLIKASGAMAILFVFLIFAFLLREGLPAFNEVPLDNLISTRWYPIEEYYGILPLLFGSLVVTIGAAIIAMPIGLLTAIFIAEIAPRWLREILKPTIELLAGIPSVVIGVFALLVMATWFQRAFGFEHRLNALVAGCALSLTIIPLVFTLAEDALSSVPKSFSDASLALGATRMYTIVNVIVPAALPGIAAGVVLGFGRAIGETMIVVMASGNAALLNWSLGTSTRTITATIAQEMAEVVHGSPHYVVLFVLGATLLLFAFATNLVAQRIVERFRRKRGGT